MDRYVIVEWPEIQYFMGLPDFEDYSFLINDEKGLDLYGSSAYFIEETWLKKAIPLIEKQKEQMKYYTIKKTGEDILKIVAECTKLTPEDLKGRNRNQWTVMARELFCYWTRKLGFSLNIIGRLINRHHSSVIHLLKMYERDLSLSLFSLASDNIGFRIEDYKREHNL